MKHYRHLALATTTQILVWYMANEPFNKPVILEVRFILIQYIQLIAVTSTTLTFS